MDLFCALLTSGISILIPLIISHITGDLIGENFITDENFKYILILIGVLAILLVIEYLAQVFVTYMGHYTGTLMESDLRSELFSHYQKLTFTFYDLDEAINFARNILCESNYHIEILQFEEEED
jgi:ATP-binding cassette subfamily B protein